MASEKDNAFVNFLYEATNTRKIQWEPAAEPDRFVASFKGKYTVIVDRSAADDNSTVYYMKLTDDADQELLLIYSAENRLVKDLFFLARRKSLNVDSAIDEIMKSVADPAAPSAPITDEDIPF
jgi:hypothetical protein